MPYGGLRFIFAHFAKIAIKCKRVTRFSASIFGTNEERVTMDSRTKFVVNLNNIQGVMDVYSRKNTGANPETEEGRGTEKFRFTPFKREINY